MRVKALCSFGEMTPSAVLREGLAPDIDVYDAAAWSAPIPLSEASVANGSAPQKFPDFTRGKWQTRQPV